MEMLNKLLNQNGYPQIRAGIGLGCDEELIIKAGQSGSGINDRIWIGKAVVDAAHLSDKANRNGIQAIAMSPMFYNNISEHLFKENEKYRDWIVPNSYYGTPDFYHCYITEIGFNTWIEKEV